MCKLRVQGPNPLKRRLGILGGMNLSPGSPAMPRVAPLLKQTPAQQLHGDVIELEV